MNVCIPGSVIGTSRHVIVSGEEVTVSDVVPKDAWIFDTSERPRSTGDLCKIFGLDNINIYSESEKKSFQSLGKSPDSVPWLHVLGSVILTERIKNITRQLEDILVKKKHETYRNIYVETQSLLYGLSPCLVDKNSYKQVMNTEQNQSIKTALGSFRPGDDGFASKPVYSLTSTSTGRLTVKSGPSILTLPGRCRKVIKSRYAGGRIVSIDFKSLEPRVALSVMNTETPDDIYSHIAHHILKNGAARKIAKVATIAALYGISFKKFSEMSGCKDVTVLDKVKEYFKVKHLLKKVCEGKFENLFGRPLDEETPQHIRISHFIQSTSCDLVNSSFYHLVKEIKDKLPNTKPLFALHDALVLDTHPSEIDGLKLMCKTGLKTMLGNFPVECEDFVNS